LGLRPVMTRTNRTRYTILFIIKQFYHKDAFYFSSIRFRSSLAFHFPAMYPLKRRPLHNVQMCQNNTKKSLKYTDVSFVFGVRFRAGKIECFIFKVSKYKNVLRRISSAFQYQFILTPLILRNILSSYLSQNVFLRVRISSTFSVL